MADLRPKTAPTVTLTGDAREATDDRPARRVDDRVGVAPGEQVGLPTGHRLADRYVIRRPIGVGGFGTVYEAEDTRLTKPVAVKVLNRSAATRHQIGRFHREAIAASQIGHPGIINVTDFGQDDDTNFMVMELLEGAELSELCERRGTLPPLEALEIVRDIAEAVGAAHREQILHRDLKPSNVFVTGSRRLKVIDFGIAKILADHLEVDGMTFEGQVMGTAEYMAPEQARGDADLDARVDVYALGVILFELVTGERPFSADSVAALMEAHRLAPTPLASERAPELAGAAAIDGLCARALAKDRDERFEGMQAFVRAIDEARASLRQGERRDGHAGRRRVTPARVALL
ncbi:MAG: serine/threonine protein kinase, partial [Myxococcales bacterium]|nr:serine/threonine protein kinase [Myxococcales bacterium]